MESWKFLWLLKRFNFLNILVLSFYYKPDLCAGSFRTSALVNELSKHKNVDIEVISTLPNRYASFSADALLFEESESVRVHRIALPSHKSGVLDQAKAFFYFYKNSMKIIKRKEYDVIYATSSRLFTAFLASRVSRKKKVPLYLDIRDIFVDTINDLLSDKVAFFARPVCSLVERYSFSKAQRINLVSAGFKGYFESRYPTTDFRWFTNGIDEEFLDCPDDVLCQAARSKLNVVYAGNIGDGQGLHEILPMLSYALKDTAHFTVIGDGSRQSRLVDALKGNLNVTLLPPVNRQELIKEYKKADVLFLHLNDYSAFEKVLPSKIFEYAALGKPILAGVSGYAARFLVEEVDNCGVFRPGDHIAAVQEFSRLSFKDINRESFKLKYSRKKIMRNMAADILGFVNYGG